MRRDSTARLGTVPGRSTITAQAALPPAGRRTRRQTRRVRPCAARAFTAHRLQDHKTSFRTRRSVRLAFGREEGAHARRRAVEIAPCRAVRREREARDADQAVGPVRRKFPGATQLARVLGEPLDVRDVVAAWASNRQSSHAARVLNVSCPFKRGERPPHHFVQRFRRLVTVFERAFSDPLRTSRRQRSSASVRQPRQTAALQSPCAGGSHRRRRRSKKPSPCRAFIPFSERTE